MKSEMQKRVVEVRGMRIGSIFMTLGDYKLAKKYFRGSREYIIDATTCTLKELQMKILLLAEMGLTEHTHIYTAGKDLKKLYASEKQSKKPYFPCINNFENLFHFAALGEMADKLIEENPNKPTPIIATIKFDKAGEPSIVSIREEM